VTAAEVTPEKAVTAVMARVASSILPPGRAASVPAETRVGIGREDMATSAGVQIANGTPEKASPLCLATDPAGNVTNRAGAGTNRRRLYVSRKAARALLCAPSAALCVGTAPVAHAIGASESGATSAPPGAGERDRGRLPEPLCVGGGEGAWPREAARQGRHGDRIPWLGME